MNYSEAISLLKALADENRLKIVKELSKSDEMCACHLLEILDCNQSTLSHHMRVLANSKLVLARKDWKWVNYSLNRELLDDLKSYLG